MDTMLETAKEITGVIAIMTTEMTIGTTDEEAPPGIGPEAVLAEVAEAEAEVVAVDAIGVSPSVI